MDSRRMTAVLAVLMIVFSSLSPVHADMREEKLDQREKMLTERALILSGESVSLDDKEQELSRRAAELGEMSKVLQEKNIDFSVREVELDELKASLSKNSALLASQNEELVRGREQLAAYKSDVEKRAHEAELIAKEADEKLKLAEKRGAFIAQREREITVREEKVKQDIICIEIAKADLLLLNETSRDVAAKIAELDTQVKNLEAAKGIYEKQKMQLEEDKQKFEMDKSAMYTLKAERDKAISKAQDLRAETEKLTRRIDEFIAMSAGQEKTINRLSADLAEKTNELLALTTQKSEPKHEEMSMLFVGIKGNTAVTQGNTVGGIMNWSDGSVRALGHGAPPDNFEGSRGKILARRAAVLDLQRNLLETIKGVQIDSQTKMSALMLSYDIVSSKVIGTISGVEVIDEKWDEKERLYTVAGQVRKEDLSGAMREVVNYVRTLRKPKEPKKTGNYTGLILDVRHLEIEPQKFFHILDEQGRAVYGIEYADKNTQLKEGLCVYFRKIVLNADEKEKVGDKPLVIKAQRIASNKKDIVIPNSEAEKIRKNKIDFRKYCKVIVVVS